MHCFFINLVYTKLWKPSRLWTFSTVRQNSNQNAFNVLISFLIPFNTFPVEQSVWCPRVHCRATALAMQSAGIRIGSRGRSRNCSPSDLSTTNHYYHQQVNSLLGNWMCVGEWRKGTCARISVERTSRSQSLRQPHHRYPVFCWAWRKCSYSWSMGHLPGCYAFWNMLGRGQGWY